MDESYVREKFKTDIQLQEKHCLVLRFTFKREDMESMEAKISETLRRKQKLMRLREHEGNEKLIEILEN